MISVGCMQITPLHTCSAFKTFQVEFLFFNTKHFQKALKKLPSIVNHEKVKLQMNFLSELVSCLWSQTHLVPTLPRMVVSDG